MTTPILPTIYQAMARVLADLPAIGKKIVPCGNGCWAWMGSKDSGGYGIAYRNGKPQRAHRVVYECVRGPIPEGLVLDHLCRDRLCVNPEHLEAVTQQTNCQRGDTGKHFKRRTHCPQGHPYDDANTYWWNGERQCRICRNAASRRYRAKADA